MTRAGHALEVAIACSQPKEMHTNPTRVMRERGIDLSGSLSNDLNRFARRRFDYVIHPVRPGAEICPEFPDSRNASPGIADGA